jgi:hypothetical protein
VYELPFDRGREDAAPRERQTDGEGGGERTSIRSENDFGSSSIVPGVDDAQGDPTDAGGEDTGRDDTSGGGGRSSSGSNGGGGGEATAGGSGASNGSDAVARAAPTPTSSSGEPSDSQAAALLVLILIIGGAVGLLSGRAWKRRAGT